MVPNSKFGFTLHTYGDLKGGNTFVSYLVRGEEEFCGNIGPEFNPLRHDDDAASEGGTVRGGIDPVSLADNIPDDAAEDELVTFDWT